MSIFYENIKALDIRSPIQKKAIEILSGLQGYSKRLELLHDQLRKELGREGIGSARISAQLAELVELGLAKEKPGSEGVRIALNRDIWELPTNVISLVWKVTEHFAKEKRADTQYSGILKAVKSLVRESGKLEGELGYSVYEILVTSALRRHHDWEFADGKVCRKSSQRESRTVTAQQELPVTFGTNEKTTVTDLLPPTQVTKPQRAESVAVVPVSTDTEMLPRNLDFVPVAMATLLPSSILADFGNDSIRYLNGTAAIEVPLSLGRGQRVYVGLRRNAVHEKVFWLFSICGLSDQVQKSIPDIFWHNNECGQFKVTFLELPTGMYVGVCHTLSTNANWENEISVAVRNLAAFGDRLEELYWSEDDF